MAHVELDRRCFEVTSDDQVIRYGWVIDNGDGKWVAITASIPFHPLVGFFDKPQHAFKALVELEKGQPWAKED